MWGALLSALPADDKQGYTPYGYGVDTPVTRRETVSYGRGWQLLRSRGLDKNQNTTHCDPPIKPNSCLCSQDTNQKPSTPPDDPMPICTPSNLCYKTGDSLATAQAATSLAILVALDANASNARFYYGKDVHKMYSAQIKLLARLLFSLERAKNTLPVFVLTSGYRVPSVEEALTSFGAKFIHSDDDPRIPSMFVPKWSSKWARASFAKVRALALSHIADKLLLLDTDTIILRNIDNLASVEAPAFVFAHKCFPRRELRSAVSIVRPNSEDLVRAQALMENSSTAVYDDLGEGSVWRNLYPRAFELPAGYATLRSADLAHDEWAHVHILHDPNLLRKAGRKGFVQAGMNAILDDISNAAELASESQLGLSKLLGIQTGGGRGGKHRHGRKLRRSKRRGKEGDDRGFKTMSWRGHKTLT